MSTQAQQDEARIDDAIALLDKIGPIINGNDTRTIISAVSALLGTVIHRHCQNNSGTQPQQVLYVIARHVLASVQRMAADEAKAVRH